MSHDILKRLGLDHLDASSPDFLKALQRLQKEAWESLQRDEPWPPVESRDASGGMPRD